MYARSRWVLGHNYTAGQAGGTGDQADGRPITSMWAQKAEAGNEKRSGKN